MKRPRLDLNLLFALRCLLVERNVTRAAAQVHLSQPAMSATLARLREYFDDPLITPVGRRMELTPLGQSLLEPVGDLLLRIDAALATVPAFDPATSRRRFVLVASDYVFHARLRAVLDVVSQEAPEVCMQVVPPTDACGAQLDAGEVDLLLVPERFADTRHPSVALFDDRHCLVVDAGNASLGEAVDLETFMACRHVLYEHQSRSHFDTWFARTHDDRRRVDAVVHSFQQVAQLVVGTPRVAVMLERLALQLAAALGLRLARLAFDPPVVTFVMQWHRHRELDPGLQWLRGVVAGAGTEDASGPEPSGLRVAEEAGDPALQVPDRL